MVAVTLVFNGLTLASRLDLKDSLATYMTSASQKHLNAVISLSR